MVSLSLNSAVAVAEGMVTVKSVAFRFPIRLKLIVFGVPEVLLVAPGVVVPAVVVVVVLMLFCSVTVAAGWRTDAQVVHFVAAHLQNRHIDDYLRPGLVQVIDQLFRQRDLVGRASRYDGPFRRQRLHPLHFHDLTQGVDNVLQFGGLGKVLQIEGLDDALLDFFALRRIVLGYENRVGRDRPLEGL